MMGLDVCTRFKKVVHISIWRLRRQTSREEGEAKNKKKNKLKM